MSPLAQFLCLFELGQGHEIKLLFHSKQGYLERAYHSPNFEKKSYWRNKSRKNNTEAYMFNTRAIETKWLPVAA